MLPDSLFMRSLVRLSVIALSSVTIASFIYFGYCLHVVGNISPPLELPFLPGVQGYVVDLIHWWFAFEILFYIWFLSTRNRLQKPRPPARLPKGERIELLKNCLKQVDDMNTFLEGWFDVGHHQTKVADIYRGNLISWLSWVCFGATHEVLAEDPEIVEELNEMVAMVETRGGIKFPEGFNPDAKCIRLNIDPVNAIHRPLIFYAVILGLDFAAKLLLTCLGFRNYTKDQTKKASFWSESMEFDLKEEFGAKKYALPYWYYDPTKSWFGSGSKRRSSKMKPIVFVHGIGPGLGCYLMFIWKLLKLGQPIFLVELPYVSMRFVEESPSMEELGKEIENMLESHGFRSACFIGHSLGSMVVSWMVNNHLKRVKSAFFIDPICFLLFHPSVAYNFVYRVPKTAREYFLHYYASKELFISNFISRYFVWFNSILLTDGANLPKKMFVYLAENDLLVPSRDVEKYLIGTNVHCRVFTGLDHASFLFNPKEENEILENVKRCVTA
ncbi:hypothetical protein K7432_005462 [Basidiobolus ranarum]|uniref:AB hydrolase-1 domain-containing protein n=1 Tax=Basidiobolus ranarum TaxID=34480 RepID=A0ABR2W346_9FUNG